MGKLYFVTGNNEQIQKQVCIAIWQWSQAQQTQPLQVWPMQQPTQQSTQQSQQPNLYLYNYLAQGSGETLAQLTATYGEEVVEPIYLRNADETEASCIQAGIYKSYDPLTNPAKCLQEIVETVFTGYKSVNYDFAAALRQQQLRQQQMRQQKLQQQQQPQQPEQWRATQGPYNQQTSDRQLQQQPRRQKPKTIPKGLKVFGKILLLAVWVLIVCLVTVLIYNAATGNGIDKDAGHLIQVTRSVVVPTEV